MIKRMSKRKRWFGFFMKLSGGFTLLLLVYLVTYPMICKLKYRLSVLEGRKSVEVAKGDAVSTGGNEVRCGDENRVVIEKIGVDMEIVEGVSVEVLALGAWRRPNTSTPKEGGNTVITGHRFQYTPPSSETFFLLDEVVEGDEVKVCWNGVLYNYEVMDSFEVLPDELWIEDDTTNSILTLYTCTPIWTASRRLVVRAELQ